jgi:hypothetical protein
MRERGHFSRENTLVFATSDRCPPPKVWRSPRALELPREAYRQSRNQGLFADLFVADAPR